MAEETTIPLSEGSDSSSLDVGLETEDQNTSDSGATEDVAALKRQIADLEQRNTQYLRERNGWESQSRRNMEERTALQERLARIEERLQTTRNESTESRPEPIIAPGRLKTALKRWLDGDETDLDAVEAALGKLTPQERQPQINPDAIRQLVTNQLVELGTRGNVQTMVGRRHPDLANPQSALTQAVFERYDTYASDQETQLMFPRDQRYEVPITGPDGMQKMVDGRVLDRLCGELRLSGAVQEGRRQEHRAATVGGVESGQGHSTRKRVTVEASELLTDGEKRWLAKPEIRKGWRDIPEDPKAAAKFFFDTFTPEEKAKRLADYKARNGLP